MHEEKITSKEAKIKAIKEHEAREQVRSDNDETFLDIWGHFGQFGRLLDEFGAFTLFS